MNAPMDPQVLLPGLGIGGYRSLRGLQPLGRLRKVTLIAGQNNSGKSNILRFAAAFLAQQAPALQWVDQPQPPGPPLRLQIAYGPVDVEALKQTAPRLGAPHKLVALFEHEVFHPVAGGEVWLTYSCDSEASRRRRNRIWALDETFLKDVTAAVGPGNQMLASASSELTDTSGGGATEDARRVLDALFPFAPPEVRTVGAFRQISAIDAPADGAAQVAALPDDYSGRNLIRRLANLESPPAQRYQADRSRFDAITQFARTVLEDGDVTIRIPAAQDEIQVHHGGRVLPLANLGTGIHQVIILAAAATLLENTLVCIEEPEVHLHPLLQRKLVRYLSEATTNQYLIEGPSDRIYLRQWLEMAASSEFIEGIHYSIMFYGGGLLRHLTAEDSSVEEFISLRRLNRHSAILIDSDKTSRSARINDTKIRIRDEFNRNDMPGFAWITACRTIENYVPIETLSTAVAAVHSRSTYQPPIDEWADPLHIATTTSSRGGRGVGAGAEKGHPDKVKIARHACKIWPADELPLDLRERMEQVVTFIRTANGSTDPLPVQPGT